MQEMNDLGITKSAEDFDFFNELSNYLETLSNDVRLKILKLIENEPKDIRTISNEIKTSYVNTKKHMDKLCMIGVIRIVSGPREGERFTMPKGHPVWKYSLAPGGLEIILRNLGMFSNINVEFKGKIGELKKKISKELKGKTPVLQILGGIDDGNVFIVEKDNIRIGRVDPKNQDKYDSVYDVVLSQDYSAVTRVSKPHAMLSSEGSAWYIEDCESKGGTYLNNKKLDKYKKERLGEGDLIWLSRGAEESQGVCLLFNIPFENRSHDIKSE